ncbi:histidine kinase [Subtercola sp. Z020]|uniref:toxin-antitoxin system HicB family antitoxin n=1 Tax=Subtercola sp. Z020 TaxID=2080582 RepID=UPI000CE7E7BA|nr:toxin-antitoxin system HicB family antitoxin [Subtercola sp. Z020]PPF77428.1 histidine kinase [Subtercola sp. Z020]
MQIDRYLSDLRHQLASVASSGGEDARAVAEQLSSALDPAMRLVLLEALSDAAGEITREIAPGSVEVRLRGRDPEFSVTLAPPPAFAEPGALESTSHQPAPREPTTAADDSSTSRTTLRLPDQLKARVERAAAHDGLSVNTWLVRAVADALEPSSRRAGRETRAGNSFTGWAR